MPFWATRPGLYHAVWKKTQSAFIQSLWDWRGTKGRLKRNKRLRSPFTNYFEGLYGGYFWILWSLFHMHRDNILQCQLASSGHWQSPRPQFCYSRAVSSCTNTYVGRDFRYCIDAVKHKEREWIASPRPCFLNSASVYETLLSSPHYHSYYITIVLKNKIKMRNAQLINPG